MFIVTLTYRASPEEIETHRPAHRAFLDRHYASNLFVASGPKPSGVGGIIVVGSHIKQDQLAAILKDDPFQVLGLADYDIVEFNAVKHAPALAPFA